METPLRILHLEDNPADAELIHMELQLSPLPMEITAVIGKEQFTDIISKEPFDLVLSDFKIPGISSYEAINIVLQNAVDKVPFIYVSGTIGEDHAVEALKAGATDYVMKSNLEKLPIAIDRAMAEHLTELAKDKALRALAERERYLQALLDNIPVSILNVNEKLEITYLNRAFNPNTNPNDFIGINILDFLTEPEKPRIKELWMGLIEGKKTIEYETWAFDEAGNELFVYCIAAPVISENDSDLNFVLTTIDLTEKKNAEKEILRQYEELQNFVYILSHNIRGPISSIMGLVQIYEKGNEDLNEEIIAGIDTTTKLLDETIKDLNQSLSLKRTSQSTYEMVPLREMADGLLQLLAEDIKKTKAVIEFDFSQEPMVYGIKSYFSNIFYNLIDNAIKYREKSRPLKVILESRSVSQDTVEIKITDNGQGMNLEADRKKRIFDMYGRLGTHIDGKGMGLYLVKTQVEALGGTIDVESKPEKGTTFVLTFKKRKNKK